MYEYLCGWHCVRDVQRDKLFLAVHSTHVQSIAMARRLGVHTIFHFQNNGVAQGIWERVERFFKKRWLHKRNILYNG